MSSIHHRIVKFTFLKNNRSKSLHFEYFTFCVPFRYFKTQKNPQFIGLLNYSEGKPRFSHRTYISRKNRVCWWRAADDEARRIYGNEVHGIRRQCSSVEDTENRQRAYGVRSVKTVRDSLARMISRSNFTAWSADKTDENGCCRARTRKRDSSETLFFGNPVPVEMEAGVSMGRPLKRIGHRSVLSRWNATFGLQEKNSKSKPKATARACWRDRFEFLNRIRSCWFLKTARRKKKWHSNRRNGFWEPREFTFYET